MKLILEVYLIKTIVETKEFDNIQSVIDDLNANQQRFAMFDMFKGKGIPFSITIKNKIEVK